MRYPSIRRGVSRAAALLSLFGTATSAQSAVTLGAGATFESYTFADSVATGFKSVTLLTVPFGAVLRPVSWVRLSATSAFASGSVVTSDGTTLTLSGLTDTGLELALPLARDRFTLAAVLSLPTGKSTYTPDEAQVAGIIAADLLPFKISNWGAGGSLDLSANVAATLGAINVGVRAGVQQAEEFDLLEGGSFSYRPGNQQYVRLAIDGDLGDSRLAVQATIHSFSDDQLNSQNLYRSGSRVQGMVTYSMPAGRSGRLQTYAGVLQRAHGTFVDGSSETPSQSLLFGGIGLRRPSRLGTLVPQADVRVLRRSDGEGQGYVAGAGLGIELSAGRATLMPLARARFGNLILREGVESGITGIEIGAGIRF
jgi:hypothetical protein